MYETNGKDPAVIYFIPIKWAFIAAVVRKNLFKNTFWTNEYHFIGHTATDSIY